MKKTIEIIVPCYNEEDCVKAFFNELNIVFTKDISEYDFAVLFVDDGSTDDTLKVIKELEVICGSSKIRYISFSRNYGKEAAMYAGLSNCRGDLIAVMDADLQHPPGLLKDMVKGIEEEGYDSCAARRISRKGEPPIRSLFSKLFYQIMNKITVIDLVSGSTDYRLMTRQMAEAVASLSENERFTKGMYAWVGFKTKWIPYHNVFRVAGKSKWSFNKLFNYASNGIIAFATTPLRAVIWFGMMMVILAFAYGIYVAANALLHPELTTGRATIVLLLIFFSGIIITIQGIIGEYMARIYMEVKGRPIYIEKDSNIKNFQKKDMKE